MSWFSKFDIRNVICRKNVTAQIDAPSWECHDSVQTACSQSRQMEAAISWACWHWPSQHNVQPSLLWTNAAFNLGLPCPLRFLQHPKLSTACLNVLHDRGECRLCCPSWRRLQALCGWTKWPCVHCMVTLHENLVHASVLLPRAKSQATQLVMPSPWCYARSVLAVQSLHLPYPGLALCCLVDCLLHGEMANAGKEIPGQSGSQRVATRGEVSGRTLWKKWTDDNRGSLIKTKMHCCKLLTWT